MDERLAAPFPYNGGKRRWAADVWARFGDDRVVYLEPFCGSMAILLANPKPCRREIVCDMSPHIANFWRAVKADPDAVAFHADYPTIHHDLRARHAWLVRWAEENGERVLEDPEHCDAKAAGWWAWGKSHWIGGMFPTDPPRDTRPHVAGRIGAADMKRAEWRELVASRMPPSAFLTAGFEPYRYPDDPPAWPGCEEVKRHAAKVAWAGFREAFGG